MPDGSRSNIDPVSRDVFQQQLVGIAEEMSVSLRRAAFSSIIWDMYDYACGLFTPDCEMIAQAETIAAQLGIMSTALRHMQAAIPLERWRPVSNPPMIPEGRVGRRVFGKPPASIILSAYRFMA